MAGLAHTKPPLRTNKIKPNKIGARHQSRRLFVPLRRRTRVQLAPTLALQETSKKARVEELT